MFDHNDTLSSSHWYGSYALPISGDAPCILLVLIDFLCPLLTYLSIHPQLTKRNGDTTIPKHNDSRRIYGIPYFKVDGSREERPNSTEGSRQSRHLGGKHPGYNLLYFRCSYVAALCSFSSVGAFAHESLVPS